MSSENSENRESIDLSNRRILIIKLISVVVFIIMIIFLIDFLFTHGATLPLALLVIFFLTLIFLGILLKRKDQTLRKRLRKKAGEPEEEIKKTHSKLRRVDVIRLDSKYHKTIIKKCGNCGMTLPAFVKKCPYCGEVISY